MGTFRGLVKRIPLTSGLQRWYGNMMADRRSARIVRAIGCSPYPQGAAIAQAIATIGRRPSGDELADVTAIEAQRQKHLANSSALVDDTLGEGGVYDQGVSVSEAFKVSKKPKPALFLYMLVRTLKPSTVLELGTNTGVSSAFIASALKRNGKGRIVTLDISRYRQRIARDMHRELGLENVTYVNGLFSDTLAGVLADLHEVDLAFIDGHHQYQPTLDYFTQIIPSASSDAVFLFDDISWSDGMRQAWRELQADRRTGLAVDLSSIGLTTLRRKEIPGTHVMNQLHYL